ncbi:MAG: hypothetical protein E6K95_05255 [Thaumarchaeota archaeon]|nr:MAG: hypothetical protein E6K95_05255 [Nitrososphaerota archaeon]
MKSRQLAAIAVILSLGVLPIAPGGVAALPSGYSERLAVYAAGSNALWYVTLSGVNASAPAISRAEAISGLTSFNLTAIKTTSWDSDFQVFGPEGYDLLRLPFIPDQGLFLTLSASDASVATSAVSAFDSYLAAAFVPLSNGSGTYSYFSPVSFGLIVPGTLLRLIPQSVGGFASLISPTQLVALASPFVTLSGQKTASGFSHSLTVGSIKLAAVASGTLQLLTLFGSSPSSIQPSKLANTSTIYVRSLDGLISSKDKATVRNNGANFSGSYSYTLSHTTKVKALNLTLLQSPSVVIATRILDKGSLNSGDTLAVTLSVKNIASQPVQNFTVRDVWWKSHPNIFTFSSGSWNFTIASIGAGQEEPRTYILKVNSSDKGEITIPSVTGSYFYQGGGVRFNGTAVFNEAQVVVGMVEPALAIKVQPSGASGNPLGTPENFTVTVTNIGSGPALNVKVANSTKQSLSVGGTMVVGVPIKFTNIIQSNISRFFTVSWQTPEGETRLLRSSLATLFFTHSSMEVGFGRVVVNATATPLSLSRMNITLRYTTSNSGHASVSALSSAQPIPSGLDCGKTSGGNITCSNQTVFLKYSNLQTGATKKASVWFVVSQRSLIFTPAKFNVTTSGFTFRGVTGGIAAPAGLVVSKTLSPNSFFRGMTPTVVVNASNRGGYVFYNATVSASADSFDKIPASPGVTRKFFEMINPGTSSSFNYTVVVDSGGSGTFKASGVAVQLLFGGTRFNFDLPQGNATVLRPLQASLSASPRSPVEGSSFSVQLSVNNPSPVQVSAVHFELKLPPGVRVLSLTNANVTNGAVTIGIPSLSAGSTYSANLTLSAASGLSLSLSGGTLTWSYSGQKVIGLLPSQSVTVHEDVLTRYAFPVVIAVLAVLAAALTIRRRVTPATAPASRQ